MPAIKRQSPVQIEAAMQRIFVLGQTLLWYTTQVAMEPPPDAHIIDIPDGDTLPTAISQLQEHPLFAADSDYAHAVNMFDSHMQSNKIVNGPSCFLV